MSQFAKIEEEAVNRLASLSGEELRLYVYIKFHTWNDSRLCKKSIHELCELYNLNYDHTTTRYKKLRAEGFCETTKKGIRAIIDLTSKIEVLETSIFEVNDDAKLQKLKFQTSKIEVNDDAKLQKLKSHIRNTEPFKDQNFSDNNNSEKPDVVVVKTNGNKSQFSVAECLRYVELCKNGGQNVQNPDGLAITLYQTGSADAFIRARLYPEQSDATEPATGGDIPERLSNGLKTLIDVQAEGEDVSVYEKWFSAQEWTWLQERLKENEQRQG